MRAWMIALLVFASLLALGAAFSAGYRLGLRALSAQSSAASLPPPAPRSPEKAAVLELDIRDGGEYRVRSVVDGDTIVLENGLHVRYHGVDTPELGHFVKDIAPMAAEAATRNRQLVENKRVRLRLAGAGLDMHGRLLARVFVLPEAPGPTPEIDVTRTLLKEGLGRVMSLSMARDEYDELKNVQSEAKAAKVGLWSLENGARSIPSDKLYCAADKSGIYHLRTCSTAARISPANLHTYASQAEAEAAGLKPCSRCVLKEQVDGK
jgi:micrococcal nuclease